MSRGGGGWSQSVNVLGCSGSSCDTWKTGWMQIVPGKWRVNDMVDGWEMMGNGPILCSANFHAVQFICMWSVRMYVQSPTQNSRGSK